MSLLRGGFLHAYPMIRVKLSKYFPWELLRQTPGRRGVWGDCTFTEDPAVRECDYWVVYGDVAAEEAAVCPAENTILFTAEPPPLRQYPDAFCAQFGTVVTCQARVRHPRLVLSQQALPWHVGRVQGGDVTRGFRFDYDTFKDGPVPRKTKDISVIASAKVQTRGHYQRLRFVRRLQERFGDRIDVFGRGIREVEDKWEALADYRYHVAIENSSYRDYWTEKLSDPLLAGALPLYYGCPNVGDYFAAGSYVGIDVNDFGRSAATIERLLAEGAYERSAGAVAEARRRVLDEYNLFAVVARMCTAEGAARGRREVRVRPLGAFPRSVRTLAGRVATKLSDGVYRALHPMGRAG